jgi:hypothetical protein
MIIKDNFLDNFLISYLNNYFLYETPHFYGHTSHGGNVKEHAFYNSPLDYNSPLINYIAQKAIIELLNKPFNILRSYINIQHQGADGSFHIDDGDVTLLLMITESPKIPSGEFEYIDQNNNIQKIEYKQNRLIIFDAKIQHRGLSYKENTPRITLAYKLSHNHGK